MGSPSRKRKSRSSSGSSSNSNGSKNGSIQADDNLQKQQEEQNSKAALAISSLTTTSTTSGSNNSLANSAMDSTSLEYLLAVPLEIVFRQIPNDAANASASAEPNNGKPLLTRAEARCFLRIVSLSQEWDILFQKYTDNLEQRGWSKSFQHKLQASSGSNSHPYLRPLVPLLQVQGQHITSQALQWLDDEMHTVLQELEQCSQSLQQFAEHNWTMSESLLDALGAEQQEMEDFSQLASAVPKGARLAREKRRLSDLEEEICNRIGALVHSQRPEGEGREEEDDEEEEEEDTDEQEQKSNGDDNNSKKSNKGIESYDTSMAMVCAQLWKMPHLASTKTACSKNDTEEEIEEVEAMEEEQDEGHQRDKKQESSKVGVFSYPEPMEEDTNANNDNKEQSYSTPLTLPGMDDPCIHQQQQQQDKLPLNMSDDDETVMDEADAQPQQQQPGGGREQQQEHSQHSVVSNNSDDENNNNNRSRGEQSQVPASVRANLHTESQYDIGKTLVMFAQQSA